MYTDPIYFDYVIFERDNWPASLQREERFGRQDILQTPSVEAEKWKLFYRSGGKNAQDNRQFAYVTSFLINNVNFPYFDPSHSSASGYVNTPEISYNTINF
jgi:hypothetical protein